MNQNLSDLLHDFGMLQVTLTSLEGARTKWAEGFGTVLTQDDLDSLPIADDEPVFVVVRSSDSETPSFLHPGEHDYQAIDSKTGQAHQKYVSLMTLPLDEFHFFTGYRSGIADLAQAMPNFFFGMSVIHAFGLFEHYLLSTIQSCVSRRPEMLGTSKQVSYGEVFESDSITDLKNRLAMRFAKDFGYKSMREQLEKLRGKLGFRELTNAFDDELVRVALIRNCLVHNRAKVDSNLADEFYDEFSIDTQIVSDMELVNSTIQVCRKFAVELGKLFEVIHPPDRS